MLSGKWPSCNYDKEEGLPTQSTPSESCEVVTPTSNLVDVGSASRPTSLTHLPRQGRCNVQPWFPVGGPVYEQMYIKRYLDRVVYDGKELYDHGHLVPMTDSLTQGAQAMPAPKSHKTLT